MSSDIDGTASNIICEDVEPLKLQQKLKMQRERYIRNKILRDTLMEMTKTHSIEKRLSDKVKDVLIFQDVLEGMSLKKTSNALSLGLNVEDLTPSELSFQEQCKVRNALEGYLTDYYQNFRNTYPHLIQANLSTDIQDKIAKDLKETLNLKQQEDIKNNARTSRELSEIVRLRTEELPKIIAKKLEQYELKMKITFAKYKVLHYRIKTFIFTETDKCIESYRQLIADIEKQHETCQKNIEDLALLKQKYATVHCKEFDSILETYLQYKSQIYGKQTLLNKLERK